VPSKDTALDAVGRRKTQHIEAPWRRRPYNVDWCKIAFPSLAR
jgi:hypothetical protein